MAAFAALAAAVSSGAEEPGGVVDVHHHLYPPAYIAAKASEILANGPGYPQVLEWRPEQSLETMDRNGVAKAILSISTPGVWFGDATEARYLARACNDYAAGLKSRSPHRFGFFAALPLPEVAASLEELDRAMAAGADGIGLLSGYDDLYLGSEQFSPLLEELNRRKAVAYVHPRGADCCRNLVKELPPAFLEFPYDTTRTIASLLYSGAFVRWPDIRFIFSHGGGALPTLAPRMAMWAEAQPKIAERVAPRGVAYELGRHFYDTASITNPLAFPALRTLVSSRQILFGTDFPFGPLGPNLDALRQVATPDEFVRITRTNAADLLRLPA